MYIYHNSRESQYRKPFGAVKTEGKVRLSVCTEPVPDFVWVRLWVNDETLVPMTKNEDNTFSVTLTMPELPCLLWYYFVAEKDGRRYFCTRGMEGRSENGEYCDDCAWQITVYDKNFKTPEWFKNSVMYQIFPDRFFRVGEFDEIHGRKSEYIIHKDWYEPPFDNPHPFEDGPACNDFYGGNIKGICAKLPYLKELGISVIYLNPIFEAFSNHRYDTGDYSKIDSLLGTNEDFKDLCIKAKAMGIHIILDGVFSHTGSDSIYFNKYGGYGCGGAYRDENSPYRGWYRWTDKGYESWWGCSNLPNVNEMEPTYIDYILRGEDAIIKKWIRYGASGWRLDVADELPDEFIKILRSQVKSENPDAVIIGEVWEDASNKESYGIRRQYLLGHQLDGVMNYPFRENLTAFLREEISAGVFGERMLTLAENYPPECLYSVMNILGTHDTIRIKNLLSGQPIREGMTFEERSEFRLDASSETLGVKRLRLAVFMQMTFVGVPCIYYGDELGMQGLGDPHNRMPCTWRCVDPELFEYYKRMITLRNQRDCLRCGNFVQLYADGGLYAYSRRILMGRDALGNPAEDGYVMCVLNRDAQSHNVTLEVSDASAIREIGSIDELSVKNGKLTVNLKAYESKIFDILI